ALAASLSNLSSAYHQLGNFSRALNYSSQALDAWSRVSPNMSHATAWYLRAQIHIELSMATEAEESISHCIRISEEIRYQRMLNLIQIVKADMLSMQERHEDA